MIGRDQVDEIMTPKSLKNLSWRQRRRFWFSAVSFSSYTGFHEPLLETLSLPLNESGSTRFQTSYYRMIHHRVLRKQLSIVRSKHLSFPKLAWEDTCKEMVDRVVRRRHKLGDVLWFYQTDPSTWGNLARAYNRIETPSTVDSAILGIGWTYSSRGVSATRSGWAVAATAVAVEEEKIACGGWRKKMDDPVDLSSVCDDPRTLLISW